MLYLVIFAILILIFYMSVKYNRLVYLVYLASKKASCDIVRHWLLSLKYSKPLNQNGINIISYYYGSRVYKIPIFTNNVHAKRNYFIMYRNKDITPYLADVIGPNHDFHRMRLTPLDLGLNDSVKIFFNIGKSCVIAKDEIFPISLLDSY